MEKQIVHRNHCVNWKPVLTFLENQVLLRDIFLIHHSYIFDLQSEFSMLFYSCWQNMMHYGILLTVNLLTWRKVSPVFYWKTETFILAHDIPIDSEHCLYELASRNKVDEGEALKLFPRVAALGFGRIALVRKIECGIR